MQNDPFDNILQNTVGQPTDMDKFVFPQRASSFMAAPMTTAMMMATRFATNKPKAEKKSHSEAESRRRKRINDHLTTLRGILPSKLKTDKATLLMETVQHVKELQQKFAEVAGSGGEGGMKPLLPTETDTVSVSRCQDEEVGEKNNLFVKATVCCEDRPDLNRDLVQLVRSVQGKITRAEMASVGGRTKMVMTLKLTGGGGEEELRRVRRGLMAVVENRASGRIGHSKRGRFVMPNRTDGYGGMSNYNYSLR
uniref:BHLH domain-containing protein n=2 Tax=Kalanchoe fedtschenkoi TaxID=63787 RepID=A0A7N1A387_KALFE